MEDGAGWIDPVANVLVPFEVLDFPLVLLGRGPRFEGAEVSTLSCLGILLARIQPILTR
jgi:hypothetical protein